MLILQLPDGGLMSRCSARLLVHSVQFLTTETFSVFSSNGDWFMVILGTLTVKEIYKCKRQRILRKLYAVSCLQNPSNHFYQGEMPRINNHFSVLRYLHWPRIFRSYFMCTFPICLQNRVRNCCQHTGSRTTIGQSSGFLGASKEGSMATLLIPQKSVACAFCCNIGSCLFLYARLFPPLKEKKLPLITKFKTKKYLSYLYVNRIPN